MDERLNVRSQCTEGWETPVSLAICRSVQPSSRKDQIFCTSAAEDASARLAGWTPAPTSLRRTVERAMPCLRAKPRTVVPPAPYSPARSATNEARRNVLEGPSGSATSPRTSFMRQSEPSDSHPETRPDQRVYRSKCLGVMFHGRLAKDPRLLRTSGSTTREASPAEPCESVGDDGADQRCGVEHRPRVGRQSGQSP